MYFWKWDLCVGAEWENQTQEIQKGWICEAAEFSLLEVPFFIAEKSHCPSCSPQWWADLLPGDHSFLWLSQVVVGLVELQPGFHISKRSPTLLGFLNNSLLASALPDLLDPISHGTPSLLFTPLYFFFLTFAYFYCEISLGKDDW